MRVMILKRMVVLLGWRQAHNPGSQQLLVFLVFLCCNVIGGSSVKMYTLFKFSAYTLWIHLSSDFGLAPLQKIVGDFCCIRFGGFVGDFPGVFSWALFPPQKRGEKIWRLNPRNNPAAQK